MEDNKPPKSPWIGPFYFDRRDKRITVPKRMGIGGTLNFGHPVAWVFIAVLALIIGCVCWLKMR